MEEKLPFGLSRETTIVRTADGRWFHDGEPLDNPKLSRAFNRWVTRAEDGRYCLKNDINWAYFKLEGAPFFVRSAQVNDGRAELLLSNDELVTLDPRSLREGPDSALYCDVYPVSARAPDGGLQRMSARFDSHAAVQLGELLEEDEQGPFFHVGNERVRPPRVANPLDFAAEQESR